MSKRYSGKSFKDSSVNKKPKLSLKEKRKITAKNSDIKISDYKSFEKKELVKDKKMIDQNIDKQAK